MAKNGIKTQIEQEMTALLEFWTFLNIMFFLLMKRGVLCKSFSGAIEVFLNESSVRLL